MLRNNHPSGLGCTTGIAAAFGLSLAVLSCSSAESTVLICKDTSGRGTDQSWVLNIDTSKRTAEMVVHVPAESIARGTPTGNRNGTAAISDRAYEITFPGDSGGTGDQSWVRLQFQFEIDRYTGVGTLSIGEEKYGERAITQLRCEPGPHSPRL
jgi:hypothetical protein